MNSDNKSSCYNIDFYDNIKNLLKELDIKKGVYLDIGAAFGIEFSQEIIADYIAFSADNEQVIQMNENRMEAYLYSSDFDDLNCEYIEKTLNGRSVACIFALDILEKAANSEKLLELLYGISQKYQAPIILSVHNITHRDIAFKIFYGEFDYTDTGLLGVSHTSFFSEKRLNENIRCAGLEQISKNDFHLEISEQNFPKDNIFIANESLVHSYFIYLKNLADPNSTVYKFIRAYLPASQADVKDTTDSASAPFLSIITRTQGKRIEELREVLLTLTAQTCIDFEVLIMGHKLDHENQIQVEQIILELPEWIRTKIQLIKVDHGNRTVPLNIGFEKAKGKYITILDDDDVVFDNWVKVFYETYQKYPGRILHAYSVAQDWNINNTVCSPVALSATSAPNTIYCADFNWFKQLDYNSCPGLSLAFPSSSFHDFGIRFDEYLTTTEDWDFIMRTAFVCGVADSSEVTSIYRLWKNAESSYSVHSQEEWGDNRRYILSKHTSIPILLPPGYTEKICEMQHTINELQNIINGSQVKKTTRGIKDFIKRLLPKPVKNFLKKMLFK